jgi:hypothetical protein
MSAKFSCASAQQPLITNHTKLKEQATGVAIDSPVIDRYSLKTAHRRKIGNYVRELKSLFPL